MRIAYLVEDDPRIRAHLVPALAELADVEVVAFADTESQAVEWIGKHCSETDLVILDIYLKRGTGLGVLSQRGGFPLGCHIVVLTNSADEGMRARCAALGAEAVFDKTTELDEFFGYCRAIPPKLH